ncbi:hypothetical protein DPMN_069969 [Dreissena polymorpha]|uniref:Uncharacterized protein n=1 Tax=Dreissena polymorpha TaxID=45954 RepID=A0A9D3Z4J5_DREPO|nr:hypothetical protein DPMN_069969 [Dreissena polymorpha]
MDDSNLIFGMHLMELHILSGERSRSSFKVKEDDDEEEEVDDDSAAAVAIAAAADVDDDDAISVEALERTVVGCPNEETRPDIQLSGLGIQPEHCIVEIADAQEVYVTPVEGARWAQLINVIL